MQAVSVFRTIAFVAMVVGLAVGLIGWFLDEKLKRGGPATELVGRGGGILFAVGLVASITLSVFGTECDGPPSECYGR